MDAPVSHETLPILEIQHLGKRFGTLQVLDRVSLNVQKGNIVSILGRSGSGKSTLLRCIAGLDVADEGFIHVNGQDITHVPTHKRNIGMMFQQFALFPHRTVAENIAFGLRMRGDNHIQQRERVGELLELVGLQGFERRNIFDLSGGEQQRVALARSLAPNPPLLLLDEPMSSLDQTLKERLLGEIRDILKSVGITALYVTHDQNEAFAVADWMVLLENGHILQEGVPEEVYHQPINRFAAEFFGIRNLIPVLEHLGSRGDGTQSINTPLGIFITKIEAEGRDFIAFPAESARIVDNTDNHVDKLDNLLTGVVQARSFRGGYYEVTVEYQSGYVCVWEVERSLVIGSTLTVYIPLHRVILVNR